MCAIIFWPAPKFRRTVHAILSACCNALIFVCSESHFILHAHLFLAACLSLRILHLRHESISELPRPIIYYCSDQILLLRSFRCRIRIGTTRHWCGTRKCKINCSLGKIDYLWAVGQAAEEEHDGSQLYIDSLQQIIQDLPQVFSIHPYHVLYRCSTTFGLRYGQQLDFWMRNMSTCSPGHGLS
jgi:hypothetical protein